MDSTRSSLLVRIKDPRDSEAWQEFYGLYAALLYRYARTRGLPAQDAEEVRDQCLAVVVRKIGSFQYDREKGGFKSWLWRIVERKVVDSLRKRRERIAESGAVRRLPDREPPPGELWEQRWRFEHLKHCVEQVRGSVSETDFEVFRLLLFGECPVEEVCRRLGIHRNQVYKAKARVLERVRQRLVYLGVDVGISPKPE
jgi:RNA polymerase sigma-70 factor (ECF subfamily)